MVVTTVDSKIFRENIYLDSNLGVAAIVATRDETMAGIQKRRTGVDCRPSHLPIVLSKSTDQEVGKTKDYIALQQMGITKCQWCHKLTWLWTMGMTVLRTFVVLDTKRRNLPEKMQPR
ncbi:hypothetical protein Bca4012_046342 [Brassica carinata]